MKKQYLILIYLLLSQGVIFGQTVKVDNGTAKGTLTNGYKTGIWEYYDSDTLALKVDYTKGTLFYLKRDTTEYPIETPQGWKYAKLDVYPRFIGSMNDFLRILATHIRYPEKALEQGVFGTVFLYFEINIQGRACNVKVLGDIGDGCGAEAMRVFNLVPNFWLTAKKNGKTYISRFILPVKFNLNNKKVPETRLSEIKKMKVGFEPAKYLPEIVISVTGSMP